MIDESTTFASPPLIAPTKVTEQTWPEGTLPVVSVLVAAYNHALFIEECLNGILMQVTSFPIEILVHDDASTDNTAELIRQYEVRYPTLFRVVYQHENQHSQGKRPGDFLRPMARGEYFAICEGDDFWNHPGKLDRQVRALEHEQQSDLCIHKAIAINHETGTETVIGAYRDSDGKVPLDEIIIKKFGQIPTASSLVRRRSIERLQAYRASRPWLTVGDIYLHFFGAQRGGAVYLNEVMSVYRYLAPNSWNSRISKDPQMLLRHAIARIDSYKELDALSEGAHRAAFRSANRGHAEYILWNPDIGYFNRVKFYLRNSSLFEMKYMLFIFPMPIVHLAAWIGKVGKRFLGH
jgi:glycosyltransferase involved in cell wall biosynthesis